MKADALLMNNRVYSILWSCVAQLTHAFESPWSVSRTTLWLSLFLSTPEPISSESIIAGAGVAAWSVVTPGILITPVRTIPALIDIWRKGMPHGLFGVSKILLYVLAYPCTFCPMDCTQDHTHTCSCHNYWHSWSGDSTYHCPHCIHPHLSKMVFKMSHTKYIISIKAHRIIWVVRREIALYLCKCCHPCPIETSVSIAEVCALGVRTTQVRTILALVPVLLRQQTFEGASNVFTDCVASTVGKTFRTLIYVCLDSKIKRQYTLLVSHNTDY